MWIASVAPPIADIDLAHAPARVAHDSCLAWGAAVKASAGPPAVDNDRAHAPSGHDRASPGCCLA